MLLDPRQQGKTSLINQLEYRCEDAGYSFMCANLTPLEEERSESGWYESLSTRMRRKPEVSRGLLTLPIPQKSAAWCDFFARNGGSS